MKIKENIKISIIFTVIFCSSLFLLYRYSILKAFLFIPILFLLIAIFSIINPNFGYFIHKKCTKAGEITGKYIAIIALFIIYIFSVIPTGFIMKLTKRDRLKLKKTNSNSYWIKEKNKTVNYEYQY